MSEYEWTCAGCGKPSPNKERTCDCPTNVVCWDRKREWKRDVDQADALSLIDRLISKLNLDGINPDDLTIGEIRRSLEH